ncbi:hypothetical protein [Spirosoma panaciterrae]|uniref:hypothetical protein n=1 Tax=Spirosoma panaciterrae TaxID=496058 RepID=UPI0005944B51|nr:hypothetical protein [Spirosoma panaciterrae]
MEMQNLWPDFAIEPTKSPKAILKEQAGYLMAKTNNVLSADVDTSTYQNNLIHKFYVVAPAMNNYRFEVFYIVHKIINFYPLSIYWYPEENDPYKESIEINSDEELINALRKIFNAPTTVKIISSLLSQSLAE